MATKKEKELAKKARKKKGEKVERREGGKIFGRKGLETKTRYPFLEEKEGEPLHLSEDRSHCPISEGKLL